MSRKVSSRHSNLLIIATFSIFAPMISVSRTLAFDAGSSGFPQLRQAPAVITDLSRTAPYGDDFLREIYVPSTANPVTTLGKPSQFRAFFGNSSFYFPPITPIQIANYAGGTTTATSDLVVMRCQPDSSVDPELAIWPNVANFLLNDVPSGSQSCRDTSTPAQAWCLADNFRDVPNQPLILSLYNAISLGKALFSINNFDGGNLLFDYYGIGSGHSGLGFIVKGSANVSFTAAQTLINSVIPEYLLKNVTLAQANCRCVRIPQYNGRDNQPLSPDFVWRAGTLANGACRVVGRILPF